jgi:hypothetical protein
VHAAAESLGSAGTLPAGDGASPSRTFARHGHLMKVRCGEAPQPAREARALPRNLGA